ncbi:hypothetical protein [Paraconexibacter sp. AEG42_29]|uniref:hypothetical protein n=1 Tax=Paraconexibacter sp. AEG42_29 TaxID=2997339 RepID=UPI00339D855B
MTVRSVIAVVLGVAALLLGSSMYIASVQLENGNERADAEELRVTSARLAESVRASSNDLTRMVRLYATTGDATYRIAFRQILAIRAGTAPRPRVYGPSFWDRALRDGLGDIEFGPPRSLVQLMRDEGFAGDEFAALRRALRASDVLARTEEDVIRRVQALRLSPGDPRATAALYPLALRLSDAAYNRAKGTIAAEIDTFVGLVDARTARQVERLSDRSRTLVLVQIGLLVAMALLASTTFAAARRGLVDPLAAVRDGARRVAAGEVGVRIFRRSRREPRELQESAEAFDAMAEAVDARIAERDELLADAARAADLEPAAAPVPGTTAVVPVDLRELLRELTSPVQGVSVEVDATTPALLAFDRERVAEVVGLVLRALGGAPGIGMTASARRLYGERHEVRIHVHAPGTSPGTGAVEAERDAALAVVGRLTELLGGSLAVKGPAASLTFIATG